MSVQDVYCASRHTLREQGHQITSVAHFYRHFIDSFYYLFALLHTFQSLELTVGHSSVQVLSYERRRRL